MEGGREEGGPLALGLYRHMQALGERGQRADPVTGP